MSAYQVDRVALENGGKQECNNVGQIETKCSVHEHTKVFRLEDPEIREEDGDFDCGQRHNVHHFREVVESVCVLSRCFKTCCCYKNLLEKLRDIGVWNGPYITAETQLDQFK